MGADQQLLFVKGQRPLLADRVHYLRDPAFGGLYCANPMHAATW
jgi:type IV secretory pathway TraG/TraD family ATPase VirD4